MPQPTFQFIESSVMDWPVDDQIQENASHFSDVQVTKVQKCTGFGAWTQVKSYRSCGQNGRDSASKMLVSLGQNMTS